MAQISIPSLLRDLTDGNDCIIAKGQTVGECLDHAETIYPGLRSRLCEGSKLRATLNVAVDGKISRRGLKTKVNVDSDIRFVPAIAGG